MIGDICWKIESSITSAAGFVLWLWWETRDFLLALFGLADELDARAEVLLELPKLADTISKAHACGVLPDDVKDAALDAIAARIKEIVGAPTMENIRVTEEGVYWDERGK